MPDFTLRTYKDLIQGLQEQAFSFSPFNEFIQSKEKRIICLRHDLDALPENSLEFAKIQAALGIKGSFYFRAVPGSWDEGIIKEIADLGHEVGYHYEDLSFAQAKLKAEGGRQKAEGLRDEETKGRRDNNNGPHDRTTARLQDKGFLEKELVDIAIENFAKNLQKLREIAPVKTICMHGSPMSRWDSRLLWKYYDYHDYGIIGEPYFDINFNEVMYLTDTGRRWDGKNVAVRDKAQGSGLRAQGKENRSPITDHRSPFPKFHSTFDIIRAAEEGKLPDKIMMTFHPQRWTDKPLPWVKELVWQNMKNVGKYFLIKVRQ